MLAIYVFIGVLAGLIAASTASAKHRSATGWFFIGFLFPLLGVILAVVLPEIPKSESPPTS